MWIRFKIIEPIGLILARKKKYNLKYSGEDNAPICGPLIVVANHQTKVDVFAVGLAMRKTLSRSQLLPWAKVEIKRGKEGFLGFLLWHYLHTIPIDRDAPDEAPKAIKRSLDYLKKRKIIFVHPEATRFPPGQVGPFRYGVANLARAAPAPILPAGIYRREEDGGIQVNIGLPFFMPGRPPDEGRQPPEGKAEAMLRAHLDILRQWSESLDRDKKGLKLMAKMIDVITHTIARHEDSLKKLSRIAYPEDNEFLREKVMELLPEDWVKA